MAAEVKKEIELEIAHVLFLDIVGYSKLSVNEQTEERYGGALQTFTGDNPAEEQRKYRYKDFYVLVEFLGGRSDDEWYFHMDGKTPLSDGEIQFFLSMTSGGKRWQKSSDVSDEPMWTLGGSSLESWKAVAVYYPKLPGTTI